MRRLSYRSLLILSVASVIGLWGCLFEWQHSARAAVTNPAPATATAAGTTASVPRWLVGHSRKKGIGMGKGQGGRTWDQTLKLLHVSWVYNWMLHPRGPTPAGVQFIPMDWGHRWENARAMPWLTAQRQGHIYKYALTFNEPDNPNQANMTVPEALSLWPQLESTGMILGSPACVHPFNKWMLQFMKGVAARHYRVDFVCVHWYGAPNAKAFLKMLHQTYRRYHRPIWITEFAVADWHAGPQKPNAYSQATVARFLKAVLPALNRLAYVHRYAWFPFSGHARLRCSGLFDKQGNLTPVGKVYASY